jgi:FUSC-like inner membrane protein yccS
MPRQAPASARAPGPVRRYLAGLRASEAYLAHGIRHTRWLDLGQFRWQDIELARAIRAALGVLVPLSIGLATGHKAYGSFAALGALPAGFVSFRGVTRTRVLAVAAAAAGMAISTFAGATTAYGLPWLLVPEVIAWAYLVGLVAALGTGAGVVAMKWAVALLIGSALPLSPAHAAVGAGLVLAGGLWQGTLVVLSWLLSRGSAERAALADSYRALSRYATEFADGQPGPPPPIALPGTRALTDPNPLLRTEYRLQLTDLLEEGERIRATLAALGPATPDATGSPAGGLADLLRTAAAVLGDLALALDGRPAERADALRRARQRTGRPPGGPGAGPASGLPCSRCGPASDPPPKRAGTRCAWRR